MSELHSDRTATVVFLLDMSDTDTCVTFAVENHKKADFQSTILKSEQEEVVRNSRFFLLQKSKQTDILLTWQLLELHFISYKSF